MPHHMFTATYTQMGIEGTHKDGAASRMPAWKELFESLGGTFETSTTVLLTAGEVDEAFGRALTYRQLSE